MGEFEGAPVNGRQDSKRASMGLPAKGIATAHIPPEERSSKVCDIPISPSKTLSEKAANAWPLPRSGNALWSGTGEDCCTVPKVIGEVP